MGALPPSVPELTTQLPIHFTLLAFLPFCTAGAYLNSICFIDPVYIHSLTFFLLWLAQGEELMNAFPLAYTQALYLSFLLQILYRTGV